MSSKVRPLGRSGFTLVELLIVVAIIGVLSTVGVPTFRRMIQKSKKTEAQVNLGGLYTAEQAFQSEYGAYGNNLGRMGFQIDGNQNGLVYVVGFVSGACAPSVTAAAGVLPANSAADTFGSAIATSYLQYFQPATGAAAGAGTNNQYGLSAAGYQGFLTGGNNCKASTPPTLALNYASFTATASGVVAPGIPKNGSGGALTVDQWTMDNTRALINTQDGVQ